MASPEGEPPLLYIDLHLVHEVTSPQAFEGIELAGRKVRRPDLTVATMDHDVPTIGLDKPIADELAREARGFRWHCGAWCQLTMRTILPAGCACSNAASACAASSSG